MNALDLADCLEALVKNNRDSFVKDAVLMLRSQEGIIEALSNRIDILETQKSQGMDKYSEGFAAGKMFAELQFDSITDEEIIKVNEDIGTCWDVPHRFAIQIARAILRKAQEK